MKEIWINLELHIKSYEFSIFKDFFRIFLIILRLLNVKNNLNKAKKGVFSCRTHVAATWHARSRGSARRAHAAPTRRDATCIYIYSYSYNMYSLPFIERDY